MFAPTKTYRRWHRKVNKNQRRYALVSALAASSSTALVLARGHRVEKVPELPLVISNETIVDTVKTSSAIKVLKAIGAYDDVQKAKDSHKIRAGKGKMRNRRYVHRRGPLIIFDKRSSICFSFRNLPGIELCSVNRLNLLQLAPGGHLGRFVVWTRGAYEKLEALYGSYQRPSSRKLGYKLPRPVITNSDLGRLINSQEIQSYLRKKKNPKKYIVHKKNPLKNLGAMIKLNPYAKTLRRRALVRQDRQKTKKAAYQEKKKQGKVVHLKPKKTIRKKKEGKAGKNFRRSVKMNPHKKKLVHALHTNN